MSRPPTPEDFEAMSAAEFDAYLVRNGMDDRIKAAMREPMTTTPGPRTKAGERLRGLRTDHGSDNEYNSIGRLIAEVEAEAIKGCIESTADHMTFLDNRAAEARADVDGLVARLRSIASIAHLAWLDPKTVVEAFQRIEALAGDKAEAPHSLDGVTARDGGIVTPEDVAYVRAMQAEKARHE